MSLLIGGTTIKFPLPSLLFSITQKRWKYHHRTKYYRLRKGIGCGRWWRYRERYYQPLGLETRKPLWYNTKPSLTDSRITQAWRWELPEAIAKATTVNQLLDTWIYYRHKRKRAKHYMKCLYRLVQLREKIDRSDWRYRTLTRRLAAFKRQWIDLPRLMLYLSILGDRAKVEWWSRSAHQLYYRYTPRQQGMILESLARVRLQDHHLFKLISDWLLNRLHSAKIDCNLLVKLLETHSRIYISNPDLFDAVILELCRRVQLAAGVIKYNKEVRRENSFRKKVREPAPLISDDTPSWEQENNVGLNIDETGEIKKRSIFTTPKDYLPNMNHLIKTAVALSELNYVDFSFFELLSLQTHHIINTGQPLSTSAMPKLFGSYVKLNIRDISLFERLLTHYSRFIYDYSPDDCSLMAKLFIQTLPLSLPHVATSLEAAEQYLFDFIDNLSLQGMENFLSFYRLYHPSRKHQFPQNVRSAAIERLMFILQDPSRQHPGNVNIPRILNNLMSLHVCYPPLLNLLCRESMRQFNNLETSDCVEITKALKLLNKNVPGTVCDLEFPIVFFDRLQNYMLPELTKSDLHRISCHLTHVFEAPKALKDDIKNKLTAKRLQ